MTDHDEHYRKPEPEQDDDRFPVPDLNEIVAEIEQHQLSELFTHEVAFPSGYVTFKFRDRSGELAGKLTFDELEWDMAPRAAQVLDMLGAAPGGLSVTQEQVAAAYDADVAPRITSGKKSEPVRFALPPEEVSSFLEREHDWEVPAALANGEYFAVVELDGPVPYGEVINLLFVDCSGLQLDLKDIDDVFASEMSGQVLMIGEPFDSLDNVIQTYVEMRSPIAQRF